MKNDLLVFFIRKPDYPSFCYVTIPLLSLVTSNLRHLEVGEQKRGRPPCFCTKNKCHKMMSKGINPVSI